MRHIGAIVRKQLKDTVKNKTILIQFIMFPVITFVMSRTITMGNMPKNFFSYLFATMYIGMAPLTSVAAIISEEKEHGVLQILQLMNVKAVEYLIGIGSYVLLICLICSAAFPLCGDFTERETIYFMIAMALGLLISVIVGATIGCISENQMAGTSITIPVMMLLSFLPMISMFNDNVAGFSKYLYTGQIQKILSGYYNVTRENVIILCMNLIVIFIIFIVAYKKSFAR